MNYRTWTTAAAFSTRRSRRVWLLAGLILLWAPVGAFALSAATVYFAGIAYTSNADNVGNAFPNVNRLLDEKDVDSLNQSICSSLKGEQLPEVISCSQLGSIKDATRSVALALGLDGETTSTQRIGDVYKLRVEISAQALFFDFKEKQVLGGFPFIIDYITVTPEHPNDTDVQNAFRGILFGTDRMHSLAGVFAATLAQAAVPEASSKFLRVTSSTLDPEVTKYLNTLAPQVDPAALPQQVAQAFGTYLAANQHISILPYGSNQALGSKMAARFAEGESYDLNIPSADYEINLNVAGLKKFVLSHSDAATVYLYGAFVDVTVEEPLSKHVYFSQRIKQGETKTVPAGQMVVDDWGLTYDTLKSLFFNFTESLTDPGNRWLSAGLPSDAQARHQYAALQELIQSCH